MIIFEEWIQDDRRLRAIDTALAAFNPTLPRRGRLMTQCKRGLVVNDGMATTSQLLDWCYCGESRRHWHPNEIRRALRQLGAKEVGRARGPGRPIIWSLRLS